MSIITAKTTVGVPGRRAKLKQRFRFARLKRYNKPKTRESRVSEAEQDNNQLYREHSEAELAPREYRTRIKKHFILVWMIHPEVTVSI